VTKNNRSEISLDTGLQKLT